MLKIRYGPRFKREYKLAKKRGCDPQKLSVVLKLLQNQLPLPEKYKDHKLVGKYSGYRECHITADWLLIYKIENDTLTLVLSRTGSHSDLFE